MCLFVCIRKATMTKVSFSVWHNGEGSKRKGKDRTESFVARSDAALISGMQGLCSFVRLQK